MYVAGAFVAAMGVRYVRPLVRQRRGVALEEIGTERVRRHPEHLGAGSASKSRLASSNHTANLSELVLGSVGTDFCK